MSIACSERSTLLILGLLLVAAAAGCGHKKGSLDGPSADGGNANDAAEDAGVPDSLDVGAAADVVAETVDATDAAKDVSLDRAADSAPDAADTGADFSVNGAVVVEWLGVSPATLTPGQPMQFRFVIRSLADRRAVFSIGTVLSEPAWTTSLSDAQGATIASRAITLDPTASTQFVVEVDPSDSRPNLAFTLAVRATTGYLFTSTGLLTFTTGATVPTPDNTITLDLFSINLGFNVTYDGATLVSPTGSRATFDLQATFGRAAQNYRVLVEEVAGASGWGSHISGGLPTDVAANDTPFVAFGLNVAAGAQPGQVLFSVVDDQGAKVKTFAMAVKPAPP